MQIWAAMVHPLPGVRYFREVVEPHMLGMLQISKVPWIGIVVGA